MLSAEVAINNNADNPYILVRITSELIRMTLNYKFVNISITENPWKRYRFEIYFQQKLRIAPTISATGKQTLCIPYIYIN